MHSSRGSSQTRDQTQVSYVSCIGRWVILVNTNILETALCPWLLTHAWQEIQVGVVCKGAERPGARGASNSIFSLVPTDLGLF